MRIYFAYKLTRSSVLHRELQTVFVSTQSISEHFFAPEKKNCVILFHILCYVLDIFWSPCTREKHMSYAGLQISL